MRRHLHIDRRGEPRPLRLIVIAWLITLGTLMYTGGPERLNGPAWATLVRWSGYLGQPVHHLGLLALAVAAVLALGAIIPSLQLRFAAYCSAAGMSWVLAVGNATAALEAPSTLTGIATYGVLAMPVSLLCAVQTGAALRSQYRPHPGTGEHDRAGLPASNARDAPRTNRGEQ